MRKVFLTIIAAMGISSLVAQSTIESATSEFASVNLSGNLNVTLIKGDSPSISVVLEDTEDKNFEWSIKGDVLQMKLKQPVSIGSNKTTGKGEVKIVYTDKFNSIKCDSKASIFCEGLFTTDQLTIDASSNSTVAFEVSLYDLNISASTGAKVSLTGKSEFISIKAATNAYVNTVAMVCDAADVRTNTNSECYVTAVKKLQLKAATNSNIFYKGEPEAITSDASSFATIEGF